MSDSPNKLSRFWQELKRRRVIHVIIVYATAAFVIIELVDIIGDPLLLPEWTLSLVIVLLAIGFPIALIFSWIYDVSLKGIKKTEQATTSDNLSKFENSIAVLPFQDMSPEKNQEYFCDGMAEEIINALTHVESLKVIARTSAFAFKDKQVDMREIGQKLDVQTLLEGSIRKDGNRLRITAQLIKAIDGSHLWSECYDRDMTDMFAIQDEISLAIVDVLKVKLLGEEKSSMAIRHTVDKEVYNLYLKGYYHAQLLTAKGIEQASGYYEKALKKDPQFALVYIGKAILCWYSTLWGNTRPKEAYPKAGEYISKALKIDNTLGEAHSVKGIINTYYHWDFKEAEQDFQKALQLKPSSALIHIYYSFFLTATERHKEAISEAKIAQELDPISCKINAHVGAAYFYGRQFSSAKRELQSVISMNPNYYSAYSFLGHIYLGKFRYKKGIAAYKKAVELSETAPLDVATLAIAYYALGKKVHAQQLFDDLEKRAQKEYIPSSLFYLICKYQGADDQAFEWFEKACKEHDGFLTHLRVNPIKRGRFPDEPRYKALLKKFGLEE
jgi:TolB-like protein/Tfp pilus assembly protein PilF